MPKLKYINKKFSDESQEVILDAVDIINEYTQQGYKLTLRQLYYQFVSRDLIENTTRSYKRLGSIIGDARLTGHIDWDAIEDRGRNLYQLSNWQNPQELISAAAEQYRIDLWKNQHFRIECWVEKQALSGIIEDICDKYRVPSLSCKGYMSLSEMWDAGYNRINNYISNNQEPLIIHLGDHDPSGIDMTRDIENRIEMFSNGNHVQVDRIALNIDQVVRYDPPPNPAKVTDSRYKSYKKEFGEESWELDALEPKVLDELISNIIERHIDMDLWKDDLFLEELERENIKSVSENWKDIIKKLN